MKKVYLVLSAVLLALFCNARCGAQIITTIAGNGFAAYSGDNGPATAAALNFPTSVWKDNAGNLYISEAGNNCVRRVNAAGIISTIAGTGVAGFSGDGGPATAAMLNYAQGVTGDNAGNVYVADLHNNRVRKIDAAGIISTVAGYGTAGYSGDGGLAIAAKLNVPCGICVDGAGNLFVSDYLNFRIRKIDGSGIITTVAGTGVHGFSGDGGPATAAQIDSATSIAVDNLGNLYVGDFGNSRVRKVNTAGVISTIAGTGTAGYSGDGGPATAARITRVNGSAFADNAGNVFISDFSNNVVRKVDGTGTITTITGNGFPGCAGDFGLAMAASIHHPNCSFTDANNNLYVSEEASNLIRKVQFTPNYTADSFSVYVFPNCSGPNITIVPNHYSAGMYVKSCFGSGYTDSSVVPYSGTLSISHIYPNSGSYSVKHVLYNGIGIAIDSIHYTYVHALCNSFLLKFYYDANYNCIKDGLDPAVFQPITVEVDSAGIAIDTLGCMSGLNYTGYGPVGTVYSFKVISLSPGLLPACPVTGVMNDTISGTSYSPEGKYVGLYCSSTPGYDLKVFASFRAGPHSFYGQILAMNTFCIPPTATITMQLSPKFASYLYFYPVPTSISGGNITWNISTLSAFMAQPFLISGVLRSAGIYYAPGDTANTNYFISPTAGDINPVDNVVIRVDTVNASLDQNWLEVMSSGCIVPGSNNLEYNIRFENTGNDTAFNIYVLDTLSDNVDPRSMRIVAASAEMYTTILKDGGINIIKFDFPGINLLDSSHHGQCDGMVIFNINVKNGLTDGTDILNRAGIYFDDNPVVMTNLVGNTIGCPTGVRKVANGGSVEIYPNPANDELTIKCDKDFYTSFTVTNTMGQLLLQQAVIGTETKLNVKLLPAGLYYVMLRGEGGSVVRKVVKE